MARTDTNELIKHFFWGDDFELPHRGYSTIYLDEKSTMFYGSDIIAMVAFFSEQMPYSACYVFRREDDFNRVGLLYTLEVLYEEASKRGIKIVEIPADIAEAYHR